MYNDFDKRYSVLRKRNGRRKNKIELFLRGYYADLNGSSPCSVQLFASGFLSYSPHNNTTISGPHQVFISLRFF